MNFLKHTQLLILTLISTSLLGMENTNFMYDDDDNVNIKIIDFQGKLDALHAEFDISKTNDIQSIKQIIQFLFEFDQIVRKKFMYDFHRPEVAAFVEKMDRQNTEQIKKILEMYGWTLISKFGKDTDMQMWLLVQHADHNPLFQAGIAFLLEQLVPLGETDPKNFVYLYDRVALKFQMLGLKQYYGTQVKTENNKFELQPYNGTLEDVDKRRTEVGLKPITEYLKKFSKDFKQ